MGFFDKKEEVLSIELTPYGRKLLSEGKMKPYCYAFFDDDILYDSEKAGFSENNTQIKDRILNQTLSLKPQRAYKGVESNIDTNQDIFEEKNMRNPLAVSEYGQEFAPSWKINLLKGEIKSSKNHMTGTTDTIVNIPQLECEVNYTMSLDHRVNYNTFVNNSSIQKTPPIGNYYTKIESNQLLVNVFEKYGFHHKDSFEIEVYLYQDDGTDKCASNNNEYTLKKLDFLNVRPKEIENDMLLDEDRAVPETEDDYLDFADDNFVEYYINFSTDSSIPRSEICDAIANIKSKDVALDMDYDCPDSNRPGASTAPDGQGISTRRGGVTRTKVRDFDIYDTIVTPQDIEDCE